MFLATAYYFGFPYCCLIVARVKSVMFNACCQTMMVFAAKRKLCEGLMGDAVFVAR